MKNKKTKRKRVYISGPISNRDKKEYMLHFYQVARLLSDAGDYPVNPTRMWGLFQPIFNRLPYKYQVILDCLFLASCDEICLLKGHEDSRGCALEKFVAKWLGLRFLYEFDINMYKISQDTKFPNIDRRLFYVGIDLASDIGDVSVIKIPESLLLEMKSKHSSWFNEIMAIRSSVYDNKIKKINEK